MEKPIIGALHRESEPSLAPIACEPDGLGTSKAELRAPITQAGALRLTEITEKADLEKIYRLRVLAWRTKLEISTHITDWHDEFESVSTHWAFLDGDMPIAAGRLTFSEQLCSVPDAEIYRDVFPFKLPGPIASLTRLVVHPAYRGHGFAGRLDDVRIDAAKRRGCHCIIIATHEAKRIEQIHAIGFQTYPARYPNGEQAGILSGTLPLAIGILHLTAFVASPLNIE